MGRWNILITAILTLAIAILIAYIYGTHISVANGNIIFMLGLIIGHLGEIRARL
jgi:hypothetical protein